MRIHYDGLVYAMQSVGGVSRYFNELLPRIAALNAAEGGRTTQSLRWGAHRPDLPGVAEVPTLLLPDHMGGGSWLKAAAYAVLRPLQNAWLDWRVGRPDIFHPTYYTTPWRKGLPTVVTVYDMIHERFPEFYGAPEHFRFRAAKAHAIRSAHHVLCISEATRRDVIEILGIEPEKTTVTLLAADAPGRTDGVAAEERAVPELLFVGSRWGYKNFAALVGAVPLMRSAVPVLTCVGGGPWTDEERKATAELRVELLDRVDDTRLAALYRRARAVVVPSLYEGFGLPVLEALAQGAVVACSDTSSLPEVAGDCAFYFDPRDPDSIADALAKAVSLSDAERAAWAVRAKARAAMFSWDKTAAATWEVYRRVAGK